MPLVGMEDLVGLIAPPHIISELLPFLCGSQWEAIVAEEHLEGLGECSGKT